MFQKHKKLIQIPHEIVKKIRPGDLIFYSPHSLWFLIIKWITRDPWVHVAMVIDVIDDHIIVGEALPRGIDVNDVIWHTQAGYSVAVHSLRLTPIQRKKAVTKLMTFIGQKYDFKGLINFLIGMAFFKSKKTVYCSDLIYQVLCGIGYFPKCQSSKLTSPHDLRLMIINKSKKLYSDR